MAKKHRAGKPAGSKSKNAPEPNANISLATPTADAVSSDQPPASPPAPTPAQPAGAITMDLTLTQKPGARASDRLVIFDLPDRKGSVQFLRTLFPDSGVPATITISGEFAPPRTRKVPETKEERKARLKALPKLTAAEKLAKAEERVAKMRAKIEAKAAAANAAAAPAA